MLSPRRPIQVQTTNRSRDFHANAQAALEEIYNNHQLYNHFDSFEHYFNIYAKRNLELWELYGKGEITKEFLNFERFSHPLVQVGAGNIKIAEQIGREFLEMLPTKTLLVAHAKKLLDYLYPKYPFTIISNGFIEVQYKKLRSSNLEHYFTHIALSEGAKALKPDKRITRVRHATQQCHRLRMPNDWRQLRSRYRGRTKCRDRSGVLPALPDISLKAGNLSDRNARRDF